MTLAKTIASIGQQIRDAPDRLTVNLDRRDWWEIEAGVRDLRNEVYRLRGADDLAKVRLAREREGMGRTINQYRSALRLAVLARRENTDEAWALFEDAAHDLMGEI